MPQDIDLQDVSDSDLPEDELLDEVEPDLDPPDQEEEEEQQTEDAPVEPSAEDMATEAAKAIREMIITDDDIEEARDALSDKIIETNQALSALKDSFEDFSEIKWESKPVDVYSMDTPQLNTFLTALRAAIQAEPEADKTLPMRIKAEWREYKREAARFEAELAEEFKAVQRLEWDKLTQVLEKSLPAAKGRMQEFEKLVLKELADKDTKQLSEKSIKQKAVIAKRVITQWLSKSKIEPEAPKKREKATLTAPAKTVSVGKSFTVEDIQKMSPEQFAKHEDTILKMMANAARKRK